MAFDGSGNLWLALPGRLVRINSASLPCTNLTDPPGPIGRSLGSGTFTNFAISGLTPTDIAVNGDTVWVANGNNIIKADISGTTVTPTTITISGNTSNLTSIALDSNNRVWVGVNASATSGRILSLPSNPSGTVTPEKTFTTDFGIGSLAFQP